MIKANFTNAQLTQMLNNRAKLIDKAIIMRLTKLGEECVNLARNSPDYTDRTGNLRSSIGYAVVNTDGEIVHQNFEKAVGTDGDEGVSAAESLILWLIDSNFDGYALVVVAGMDYAYYVESTGRDVLSSAEHYAENRMSIILREMTKNI